MRDFLYGLTSLGILGCIDKESFIVVAGSTSPAVDLATDSTPHGQAVVRWRQGATGWPQQWIAQHVGCVFTEAYGGPELWQRLVRLAATAFPDPSRRMAVITDR